MKELIEKLFGAEKIIASAAPSNVYLDDLCFLYLIKRFINKELILKNGNGFTLEVDGETIHLNDLKESERINNLSKSLYTEMLKHSDSLRQGLVHNTLKLIDYCARSATKNLAKHERRPGSLIHVIYSLKETLSLPELFEVFAHFADKIFTEPDFLTSLCDVELSLWRPELMEKVEEVAQRYQKLMTTKIRFAKIDDNFWVAFNFSDANLVRHVFKMDINVKLYIYINNEEAGVIFKYAPGESTMNTLKDMLPKLSDKKSWEIKSQKRLRLMLDEPIDDAKKFTFSNELLESLLEIVYDF